MADRAKFLDFLDRIDGGGAGQRGNQFEGGGIFSMLANLMPINPYGSEDKVRREARDAFYGGLLGDGQQSGAISAAEAAATPSVVRQDVSGVRPTVMVGSMPAAPQNMVRPEVTVGGMPAAPQNMVRPEFGVGGMPAAPQNMMESGTRPIRPMPEALPAGLAMPISSSNLFPSASQEIGPNIQQPEGMMMSKQQFVNFILPKYREEYGRNPSQQQMDMAYNTYMSNMGLLQ